MRQFLEWFWDEFLLLFFAGWSCANLKLLFCNDRVGVKGLHVNTGIRTDLPSFVNLSRKTVLLSYF